MEGFLGKALSLVTIANIRYSGTLVRVDIETQTITLENVTSWGTEDREPANGVRVPPAKNPYAALQFQSAAIKDLHMLPELPPDPAIVGAGTGNYIHPDKGQLPAAPAPAPIPAPVAAPPAPAPAAAPAPKREPAPKKEPAPRKEAPAPAPKPIEPPKAPWTKGAASGAAVVAGAAKPSEQAKAAEEAKAKADAEKKKQQALHGALQPEGGSRRRDDREREREKERETKDGYKQYREDREKEAGGKPKQAQREGFFDRSSSSSSAAAAAPSDRDRRGPPREDRRERDDRDHHRRDDRDRRGDRPYERRDRDDGFPSRRPYTSDGGGRRDKDAPQAGTGAALLTRRTYGTHGGSKPEDVKGDFDFESSNAKFHKEGEEKKASASASSDIPDKTAAGADGEEVPTFALKPESGEGAGAGSEAHAAYSAKSSFFDTLTTDNAGTRLRRDDERRLNSETFGATGVAAGRRFYGHGSGGGHGGGRGGYHHHDRDRRDGGRDSFYPPRRDNYRDRDDRDDRRRDDRDDRRRDEPRGGNGGGDRRRGGFGRTDAFDSYQRAFVAEK